MHPLHEVICWPHWEGRLPEAPSNMLSVALLKNTARSLGPGFSLSLICPLLPLPKCLLQKSSQKCRWKMLMLTASPSSWRRVHPHLYCQHLLLPILTHLQYQDLLQEPTGHLFFFSWAFHSSVPSVHLAAEETEAREGK